jgi:hypothetical protein
MFYIADAGVEALRQNGHDVAWIKIDSPGISDPQVLSHAQAENRNDYI